MNILTAKINWTTRPEDCRCFILSQESQVTASNMPYIGVSETIHRAKANGTCISGGCSLHVPLTTAIVPEVAGTTPS
jgi:hypothetical protein